MSVTLHCDCGDIKVELFCEQCPKTCENFLALCASGYYDECTWHRIIKGFMCQTGDPTGTGKGGESIWGGHFRDEIKDVLKHKSRGVLSMANSGPNTNASQFFITFAAQSSLDLKYTVFGKVIDGFEGEKQTFLTFMEYWTRQMCFPFQPSTTSRRSPSPQSTDRPGSPPRSTSSPSTPTLSPTNRTRCSSARPLSKTL